MGCVIPILSWARGAPREAEPWGTLGAGRLDHAPAWGTRTSLFQQLPQGTHV